MERPYRAVETRGPEVSEPTLRQARILLNGHDTESVRDAITEKIGELSRLSGGASRRIRDILSKTEDVFRSRGAPVDDFFAASNIFEALGSHQLSTDIATLWKAADLEREEEVQKILLDLKTAGLVQSDRGQHRWSLTNNGRAVYELLRSLTKDRMALFDEIIQYEDKIKQLKAIRRDVKEYEAAEKEKRSLWDTSLDGISNITQLKIAAGILDGLIPRTNGSAAVTTTALHQIAQEASNSAAEPETARAEITNVIRLLESTGCITCRVDGLWMINDMAAATRFGSQLNELSEKVEELEISSSGAAADRVKRISESMAKEGIAPEQTS